MSATATDERGRIRNPWRADRVRDTVVRMTAWQASISANHRKNLAPSPRCVSFYPEAIVISCGPSLFWKRFGLGSTSGSINPLTGTHSVDQRMVREGMAAMNLDTAQQMFEQARMSTPTELLAAHEGNVLIPRDEFVGVHVRAKSGYAKYTITRTNGSAIVLWSRTLPPGFGVRVDTLKKFVGDRLTTEGVVWNLKATP